MLIIRAGILSRRFYLVVAVGDSVIFGGMATENKDRSQTDCVTALPRPHALDSVDAGGLPRPRHAARLAAQTHC